MKYQPLASGILQVAVLLALTMAVGTVGAFANHDEAMAMIAEGEAMMLGDLTPAISIFEDVLVLYPDNWEAGAWARVRLAEIAYAGESADDGIRILSPLWADLKSPAPAHASLAFWCGFHYARCLAKGGQMPLCRSVATRALDIYEQLLPEPGEGATPASGWLHYFLAQAAYWGPITDHGVAASHAGQALQIGEAVHDTELTAWAALMLCQTDVRTGQGSAAVDRCRECVESHAVHAAEYYGSLSRTYLVHAMSLADMVTSASEVLRPLLDDPNAPDPLKAEALCAVAQAAERLGDLQTAVPAWRTVSETYGMVEYWPIVARGRLSAHRDVAREMEHKAEPHADELMRGRMAMMAEIASATQDKHELVRELLRNCGSDTACIDAALATLKPSAEFGVGSLERWQTYDAFLYNASADIDPSRYSVEKAKAVISVHFVLTSRGDLDEDGLREALALCDAALSMTDGVGAVQLLERKAILHGYLDEVEERESTVAELVERFCTAHSGACQTAMTEIAAYLAFHQPDASLSLAESVLASEPNGFVLHHALFTKAVALQAARRFDESVPVLEELISLPPDTGDRGKMVGNGQILLANYHFWHRQDASRSEQMLLDLIQRKDELPAVYGKAVYHHVNQLVGVGRSTEALEWADVALSDLTALDNEFADHLKRRRWDILTVLNQ